jgi:hypothetical protein
MNRAQAWLVANHVARNDFALARLLRLGDSARDVKRSLLQAGTDARMISELAQVDVEGVESEALP